MQSHIWLTASSWGKICTCTHSYTVLGSPSYDFAPDPIWISLFLYEENFVFFLSVYEYTLQPQPFYDCPFKTEEPPSISVPIPPTRSHQHAAVTCNGNHHEWFAKNILASGRASATKQPDFRLPGAVTPKHSRVLGCLGAGTVWEGWARRKIRLIESNTKCRHLKKITCKVLTYLSEAPSSPRFLFGAV